MKKLLAALISAAVLAMPLAVEAAQPKQPVKHHTVKAKKAKKAKGKRHAKHRTAKAKAAKKHKAVRK